MPNKTSPELLATLFTRFQRRAKAETGVKVSMRKVSEELLSRSPTTAATTPRGSAEAAGKDIKNKPDANALGRWTNPGLRANWFIPVGRVLDVARQLGATSEERDALMLARLTEIAEADPMHHVLVCGAWVAERVSEQHRLDDDEQEVIDVFRRTRAISPYSMLNPTRLAKLERFFEDMAREHLAELASEQAEELGDPELSSERQAKLRERAIATVEALRASRTSARKEAQLSAEVVARRFLRGLRKPQPRVPG